MTNLNRPGWRTSCHLNCVRRSTNTCKIQFKSTPLLLLAVLLTCEAAHLELTGQPDAKTSASSDSYDLEQQLTPYMQVHKLAPSNNITCNDGSSIGYYKRLNSQSKSWIIYLQGGGFCGSEQSCRQRWQQTPQLMSSNFWPKTKTVDGILSSNPKENPYLWNANHIYVPYCSSDSWTGLLASKGNGDEPSFSFMGSKILERVIESLYEDLDRDSSLHEAKFVLLAGDSAGATGVILNLDRVNDMVQLKASSQRATCLKAAPDQLACETKQTTVVRGLADSGWFLDNEPYNFESYSSETYGWSPEYRQNSAGEINCDQNRCTPLQSIRQAMRFWNGQVPKECRMRHLSEPWRCYFGYRVYQTLQTPLFVVQWLYDEAQLMVDNIARPGTSGQWNYVNKVVNELRASLENVTALFAPSCFSHSLIARRSWSQININGFKLPHILNSWEEQSLIDTTIPSAISSSANGPFTSANSPHATTGSVQNSTQTGVAQPMIVNQSETNFEFPILVEQDTASSSLYHNLSPSQNLRDSPHDGRVSHQDLRHFNHRAVSVSTSQNRSRNRKRKRNNQQQRSKQSRSKSSSQLSQDSLQSAAVASLAAEQASQPQSRDSSNDLSGSLVENSSMQGLLPVIDRSAASGELLFGRLSREPTSLISGRLGRSTIVDDATLMLGNNVPDDNLASQTMTIDSRAESRRNWHLIDLKARSAGSFRFMDTCGWPQCNRDCPILGAEFTSSSTIHF